MPVHKAPLLMGGTMGLIMPWMMHMESGSDAGLVFVLAHVALLTGVLALATIIPRVRRKLGAFRSHLSHLPIMGAGLAAGWGATCAFCLAIGGVHWT